MNWMRKRRCPRVGHTVTPLDDALMAGTRPISTAPRAGCCSRGAACSHVAENIPAVAWSVLPDGLTLLISMRIESRYFCAVLTIFKRSTAACNPGCRTAGTPSAMNGCQNDREAGLKAVSVGVNRAGSRVWCWVRTRWCAASDGRQAVLAGSCCGLCSTLLSTPQLLAAS
jgi:hypothetical protein